MPMQGINKLNDYLVKHFIPYNYFEGHEFSV